MQNIINFVQKVNYKLQLSGLCYQIKKGEIPNLSLIYEIALVLWHILPVVIYLYDIVVVLEVFEQQRHMFDVVLIGQRDI